MRGSRNCTDDFRRTDNMPQFDWYVKRARVMTGREVLHRVAQAGAMLALSAQHRFGIGVMRRHEDPSCFAFCTSARSLIPPPRLDHSALRRSAGELLEGRIEVAGRPWRWDGSPDAWHRAPDTGRTWPRNFFGNIPYRHGNPYGDIRQLWEPSRLQQLVDLAALAKTSNSGERDRAVHMVEAQLTSWVQCNAPLTGPHYISAMECALRLIAACHALDTIREYCKHATTWRALVQLVGSHALLIERRLSMHSSIGNHTVAEATGLVYAGQLFPEMQGSSRRLEKGLHILANLARTQVLADGGGAEQAPAYHLFNVHLLSLVAALLPLHGRQAAPEISSAVDRGSRFIDVLKAAQGALPSIGDGDGGYALSRHFRLDPGLRASIRLPTCFEQSGYTVAQVATAPATSVIFDHGPLGMPPSFGHGHADALSLILHVEGAPVLIDPGTYTYTGDQDWRRYFRATRAHNTVTVDGRDQALQEGSFLWSKPFRSRVISAELDGDRSGQMLAEHDGYTDIGVRHLRGIAWQRDAWLLVWDALLGSGEHDCELNWHIGCETRFLDSITLTLEVPGSPLTVRCSGGNVTLHSAERAPIRGWRSPRYGVIEPGQNAMVWYRGQLPHTFETIIGLRGNDLPDSAIGNSRKWMQNLLR